MVHIERTFTVGKPAGRVLATVDQITTSVAAL